MASIFMRIDGNDTIKGAATVVDLNSKKGWFAVDSLSWGAMRGVSVDIGNANNQDSGMVALGEISISKTYDGATPYLLTYLFQPGADGKTIELVMTKPSRDGKGIIPYYVISLEEARMANFSISGSDGGQPSESFSLTYTKIEQIFFVEDEGGKLEKAASVKYDATTNQLTSAADLK
ncbi:Hcp1 family type VI secretion system effector [Pseudoalteromonas citrea]|uniref:Hcp1 family type VI secretion system effector n=3 Tax=Pseudoalteromonas TaxID=53246 RepID=A0A5S3XVN5_9GAMM|nr:MULTISPECIES: type VI secretion system tube protein Hcp [Pseudoalteromonas]KAF7772310.1 type VI secretion system secreted protein Hcp [Pseudoalteromonas citrea]MBE0369645.1 type VI secretion system secreted protein Hcp [Pseudoalteromonas aurantia 208]MBQ4844182.1 type VI secretion system tube protein Hcp [Pseudoalteromonas sp. MMG005]MBQ4861263.1 type VI secretion system tube protein Hcp [Pseudoalteromonas sp. MMG013]RJE76191.1 hypothetical protein BGP78_14415 [Pseudoalteromonas sp. MSK9-3]